MCDSEAIEMLGRLVGRALTLRLNHGTIITVSLDQHMDFWLLLDKKKDKDRYVKKSDVAAITAVGEDKPFWECPIGGWKLWRVG